ncbi:hypothetical protein [Micromonospora sp. NBC_01796]|uniref:hypothetical protein n=1 Tax=Micromonospora sp. NBC_01796 TaxID=2975987 RepID=UPI002DD99051|nr:hypothetical protein [Micromonospora sp. NBC_01796]WSA83240.1 hypothetical protein OIE47_22850 [Micromonospora sp. NBC_01796]
MARQQPIFFETEVRRRFQFLVDAYHTAEPEYSELLLPGVLYKRPDLWVWVFLESGDGAGTSISVSVDLLRRDWPAKAELPDLVEAAEFAPRHLVTRKAHTPQAVRDTLDQSAIWLRRLMPLLLSPDAEALVRRATRHPLNRAGNPKPRNPNTKWKYA